MYRAQPDLGCTSNRSTVLPPSADLVPDDRTPEETTGFYVALGKAVRDAGSSSSDEEFI